MLKISPIKGVRHFGKKGKFVPRYIGPFRVLERIGKMAYRLQFPDQLAGVHDVFYVSMLRKFLHDGESASVTDFRGLVIQLDCSVEVQP